MLLSPLGLAHQAWFGSFGAFQGLEAPITSPNG